MADTSTVEVTPVSVHDPAARACLDRYFEELAARFPEGFTPPRYSVVALDCYSPPAGVFLMARSAGDAVGCGALRLFSPGVGEIKHMWVAPQVRGRGVGRMLLAALERAARERHLLAARLDTNSSHHWLEKALD